MFWTVTVLQGPDRSLYSVQLDASSNIGVFLTSVGKCRNAKVNKELTSSFLLKLRNTQRKIFSYSLRLTVKIARPVHACLNGTNDFRKAEKASFEVQGHVECFLWYLVHCDGTVCTQRPDGKSAVLHWSLDEIAWRCEKGEGNDRILRNGWVLHQDNAPAHYALSVQQILANTNITVLEHPPYSPDLIRLDFCLFPKIKSVLKGTHFVSVENVKTQSAENLKSLREHDLLNCFEHWQHRMQLSVNSEGNYFEGDLIWFPELIK